MVQPSNGSRFFVRVPATGNLAFVDRVDVGPASPPPSWLAAGVQNVLVRAGDSVTSISARFGVPAAEVLAANHLGADGLIVPGQVLLVPAKRR